MMVMLLCLLCCSIFGFGLMVDLLFILMVLVIRVFLYTYKKSKFNLFGLSVSRKHSKQGAVENINFFETDSLGFPVD